MWVYVLLLVLILAPRCFSPSIMFYQFEEVERTGPLNQQVLSTISSRMFGRQIIEVVLWVKKIHLRSDVHSIRW